MNSFSSINIRAAQAISIVADISALRRFNPPRLRDGDSVLVAASQTPGDQSGGAYTWIERSQQADDGVATIKPAFATVQGRWIKMFGSVRGDKGDTGLKGDKGDTGTKGDKGDIGLKGDKGDAGAKGDTGLKGDTGTKGDKGDTGLQGPAGPGTGDMSKSENLSGLANYSTARTNLGLGSAAIQNVGTSASNVPQLDSNGKVLTVVLPESLLGAMRYQGTWDASANNPALATPPASSTKGFYYVVSTAGATNLSGITDWKIGDWAVSNGSTWDKVDSSDQVNSVAGLQGSITKANLQTALDLSGINTGDQANISGNAGTATKLQTSRTIAATGDIIYSVSFDGSQNVSAAASLAIIGSAGTSAYPASVSIDNRGRVTSIAAGVEPLPRKQTIVTYTAAQTIVSGDSEALVRFNSSSALNYTVPTNASLPLAIGTRIDVMQLGAGKVTVVAASGVTFEASKYSTSAQYAAISLIKTATDTWAIVGSLS